MNKTRLLIGFLCAFSGYALAAPAPAEKDVAQAVDHLTQAMLHKDIAELNALTAPNLTYGHSSGKIQDKRNSSPTSKPAEVHSRPLKCKNRPSLCLAIPRWCVTIFPRRH